MAEEKMDWLDQERLSDQMNDPSDWYRRKLKEISNDPSEQIEEKAVRAWAFQRRIDMEEAIRKQIEKEHLEQQARTILYFADDIHKHDLFGRLISVKKNPEHFAENFDDLRNKLRDFLWGINPDVNWQRFDIQDNTLCIRYGVKLSTNLLIIDYFVDIKETYPKIENTLENAALWGIYEISGNR